MFARIHFLLAYVGSAAVVAFVAACMTSPRIATFACHTSGANGAERCELATEPATDLSEAGAMNRTPDAVRRESATMTAAR